MSQVITSYRLKPMGEQLRTLDKSRILKYVGTLRNKDVIKLNLILKASLGL